MKTFHIVEDGSSNESFHDAVTTAHYVASVADALRADAARLDRMVSTLLRPGFDETSLFFRGSYLVLDVVIEQG